MRYVIYGAGAIGGTIGGRLFLNTTRTSCSSRVARTPSSCAPKG